MRLRINWISRVGVIACAFAASGWNCESPQSGGNYHIPDGWQLNPKRTQMLARSYPKFSWISLIVQEKDREGWLFTVPHPAPFLPSEEISWKDMLEQRTQRSPLQRAPSQAHKMARAAQRQMLGFSFRLRTSKPIRLRLRLRERNPMKLLQPALPTQSATKSNTYTYTFDLPRTGRRWHHQSFRYQEFQSTDKEDREKPHPIQIADIRFEIAPPPTQTESSSRPTSRAASDESTTLTIQGPFPIIGRPKLSDAQKKKTPRPAPTHKSAPLTATKTRQTATKASSRPHRPMYRSQSHQATSRPGAKLATTPGSLPTSQPHPPKSKRKRP